LPYAVACRPFRAYEWLFLCARVGLQILETFGHPFWKYLDRLMLTETLKGGFYLEMLLLVMNVVILMRFGVIHSNLFFMD
jgi:hypothetical protein